MNVYCWKIKFMEINRTERKAKKSPFPLSEKTLLSSSELSQYTDILFNKNRFSLHLYKLTIYKTWYIAL